MVQIRLFVPDNAPTWVNLIRQIIVESCVAGSKAALIELKRLAWKLIFGEVDWKSNKRIEIHN